MFATLQRIGRSLMMPIAVLPAAALALGLGNYLKTVSWLSGGETLWLVLEAGGNAVIGNLPAHLRHRGRDRIHGRSGGRGARGRRRLRDPEGDQRHLDHHRGTPHPRWSGGRREHGGSRRHPDGSDRGGAVRPLQGHSTTRLPRVLRRSPFRAHRHGVRGDHPGFHRVLSSGPRLGESSMTSGTGS